MESEGTWHNHTLQLAWAAGLFDGEGCSSARPQKRNANALRIQASVSQSSHSAEVAPSVLVRFQQTVGGMGSIGAPYFDERSGTFAYQWRAGSYEEAQAVIALLWANLGAIKRAQAADALGRFRAQYETIRPVYRTPTRARRLSLSLPGPAASAKEQHLAWAAGLLTAKARPNSTPDELLRGRGSLCGREFPSAMRKVSRRSCSDSRLLLAVAGSMARRRARDIRMRTSGTRAPTTRFESCA